MPPPPDKVNNYLYNKDMTKRRLGLIITLLILWIIVGISIFLYRQSMGIPV